MRLVLRTTLLLVALYATAVFGLITLVDHLIENAAWQLMEDTTRMFGNEIGSAMTDPILESLLSGRTEELKQLSGSVFELVNRSPLVLGAVVVNGRGEPVAATGAEAPPPSLPSPRDLFAADRRARLVSLPGSTLRAGLFQLDIPLLRDNEPLAYLRLTLGSSRISALYDEARRTLLISSGAGILLIGLLGFGFHLQLSRQERLVVTTLEGALQGRSMNALQHDVEDIRPVLDAAGRLSQALSDERAFRSAAEHSIAQLGQLLDVGVLMINAQGRVEFAGAQTRRLLGFASSVGDGDSLDPVLAALAPSIDAARRARSHTADVEIPTEGGPRKIRCSVRRLDETPQTGFIVLLRDPSVLDALETDLRQAAQLRGMTRLYRGVAHDLKAPLNAMVLNLELLKRSIAAAEDAGSDEERSRRLAWVRVVEEELARLGRAMESLLSQTAPMRAQRDRFDLAELIEEIQRLLEPQARQQHVHLAVDAPRAVAPVLGRRDALKQAILNLAINGLEAMPNGGTLSLAVARNDDAAVVRVQDTGPGIPDVVRERIFEMHVTTKASGTGIGLYVARSVAESDGGSLELVETSDGGTTFQLGLPLTA
jgi:signal transduction histidine kinase